MLVFTVSEGQHEIDGFRLKKGPWPFKMHDEYRHAWKRTPRLGSAASHVIKNNSGTVVASFEENVAVTLDPDYSWDGNSGPAVNTLKCLRASALHDAWCQAMQEDIFEGSWTNWMRGASEYRKICRDDGMCGVRAWLRYVAIATYGSFKEIVGERDGRPRVYRARRWQRSRSRGTSRPRYSGGS